MGESSSWLRYTDTLTHLDTADELFLVVPHFHREILRARTIDPHLVTEADGDNWSLVSQPLLQHFLTVSWLQNAKETNVSIRTAEPKITEIRRYLKARYFIELGDLDGVIYFR